MPDWSAARAAMLLDPTVVNLNTGSFGPTPRVVFERATALRRRHGVLSVVDGAHAPAMVDVNIDALDCDFYGGNCHKWLLAPIGSGFLALGRNSLDRLQPLLVSWGYYPDRSRPPDERDEF